MFTVNEVMNTELITLSPDDSLSEARKLMAERHIRHIPIVEKNDRLVGLVTQRDVLAAADSSLLSDAAESQEKEQYVAVSSVMTVSVNTIDEGASLRGVALYLQKHKIGCLPVVRGNKLVGIVTDSDFVGVAINLLEQLEERDPLEYDETA